MKFKLDNKAMVKENNFSGDIKVPLKFDLSMLNMFAGYVFKKSSHVTRKSLTNMKKLFDIIDERIYVGNDNLYERIAFIRKALYARVVLNMENEDVIINYCRKDNEDNIVNEIIQNIPIYSRLNFEEIKFINKAVFDRLQYFHILRYKDELYETIERLDSGDYSSYQEVNTELLNICKKVITDSRKTSIVDTTDTFSLDSSVFETGVTDIVNRLKDPARILKTGIQCLNKILSPGYMSKRLYMYMGLPAGFKSGILLKSAIDIKRYNKGVPVKKDGHRPVVLIVTMENTVEESVERLFNMTVTPTDIRNFTPSEVIEKLKSEGGMTLADDNDIDIIIKYYPNRSIDTGDLYTIIEELSDDNKEVIALVLDYIKRIRPAEYAKDEKEELKNVTNELHSLAVDFDIPVITAHQLNRGGASAVDAAMQSNKEDLARFVGRSNVGSAWEVMENSDWVCIINVEKKKSTGQYYLTFKRVKLRYREMDDLSYFNHPFEMGAKIQLIDDINLDRQISEESLATDFEGVDLNTNNKRKNAKERSNKKGSYEDDDFESDELFKALTSLKR